MNNWYIALFLLFSCMHPGSHSQDVHFHCLRSGQHCVHPNATCDFSNGQCVDCPSDFAGYDCSFNMTEYITTECGLNCQNGATCYTNWTDDELCLCTPDYYGILCDQERVMVTCNGENMTVSLATIQPFEGVVYLGDLNPQPECLLENDTSNAVYSLTLSLIEGCKPHITNNTLTGDVTYTRELTLQYDADFQSGHDLSINLTCFHSANQTREPAHALGAPRSSKSQGGSVKTLYQPAQLAVVHLDTMTLVTGVVIVGQRLALFNYLNDDSVFKRLVVERCVISNPSFTKALTLIYNGCPTERAQALGITEAMVHNSPFGIKHEFSMIRFGNEPQVLFSCVVRMCRKPDDAACQMVACTNARTKRAAGDEMTRDVSDLDNNEQVTRTSVIVLDPKEEADKRSSTSEECLQKTAIRAVIASLASLAAVLLFLVGVIAAHLRRGNHKKLHRKDQTSSSFYNSAGTKYQEFDSPSFSESTSQTGRDKHCLGSGRFSLPSINVYRY